jgi:hypothetical protein
VVAVVALFAAGGMLAGLVWEWLWTPPSGVVVDGEWLLDTEALRADFSGTALYVLVATVTGLLLGTLAAMLFDRHELATLVAVVAGSALAAWLMWQVGHRLGPPDPELVARSAEDGARVPGRLEVVGRSPFAALPSGALLGVVVVFIGLTRRPGRSH